MKSFLLIILTSLLLTNKSKTNSTIGVYNNQCYERLEIRTDSTFMLTYPVVSHFTYWASGTWKVNEGLLILEGRTIYDTIVSELIIYPNADTTKLPEYTLIPLDNYGVIESYDTISRRIDGQQARARTMTFSRLRQDTDFTDTLQIETNGLIRIAHAFNSKCCEIIKKAPNKK